MASSDEAETIASEFTDSVFESVLHADELLLVTEIFGYEFGKKVTQADLVAKCISFKTKHESLIRTSEEWGRVLLDRREDLTIHQNIRIFLKDTLRHLMDETGSVLLMGEAHIPKLIEGIIAQFENSITNRKHKIAKLRFLLPGLGAQSCSTQNNFILEYLMGWIGRFVSITDGILSYNEDVSLRKNKQFVEETTHTYLSNLVYNPSLSGFNDLANNFELLQLIYEGEIKKIVQKAVGLKVYKRLSRENKSKLKIYFENLSEATRKQISNRDSYEPRLTIKFFADFCRDIFVQGVSRSIFPKENLTSCANNVVAAFRNNEKLRNPSHIFTMLEPCANPVPVPFIESLYEDEQELDFCSAIYYNSMYFFKIFILQVIRLTKYLHIKDNNYVTYFIHTQDLFKSHLDKLDRAVQLPSSRRKDSVSSTSETTHSSVKAETESSKADKVKEEVDKREVRSKAVAGREVSRGEIEVHSSKKPPKTEVKDEDEDVMLCSPTKKPYECVTLDTDSDFET